MPDCLFRTLRGLSPADFNRDLAAGLTLAAIAIPEQMATARLGGFPPQIGFFAFIAGTLAFAAFGSSRLMSVGADSTITPIFAGSLALLAASGSPEYAGLAAALALMVGAILIAGGILRLGWIADLLSRPVITGFLAGISVHIVLSQAPTVLGVPSGGSTVYERMDRWPLIYTDQAACAGARARRPRRHLRVRKMEPAHARRAYCPGGGDRGGRGFRS